MRRRALLALALARVAGAVALALPARGASGLRGRVVAVSVWSGYFNANTPSVHHPGSAFWRAYSPQLYAPSMQPALRVRHPRISFYVGSRDGFAGENVAFDHLLTGLGVAHRFNLVPGAGHGWSLWSAHYDSGLKFLAGALR